MNKRVVNGIKTAVQRGIKLLDKHKPGWEKKVKVTRLDMGDCRDCVLGQLYGGYSWGLQAMFEEKIAEDDTGGPKHGFDIPLHLASRKGDEPDEEYKLLNQLWADEVRRRRKASRR